MKENGLWKIKREKTTDFGEWESGSAEKRIQGNVKPQHVISTNKNNVRCCKEWNGLCWKLNQWGGYQDCEASS